MRYSILSLTWLALAALTDPALAASIEGHVTGPDGAPLMGVFVVAENVKTKMTVNVLSDDHGRFVIRNLGAALYKIKVDTVGYRSASQTDVQLSGQQTANVDVSLQKRPVRWSDLTTFQGRMLLPKAPEHPLDYGDIFFTSCLQSCHSFQKQMSNVARDREGWRALVVYMNEGVLKGYGHKIKPQDIEDFSTYLTAIFGPNSTKPASPEDLPAYKTLIRVPNKNSMNIVYVEYDFPAESGIGPWSAAEDRDGMIWIPYNFSGNAVVRLNPETAEMTFFKLPSAEAAGVHSVIPAPDGTVWFVELERHKIGHLDPATGKISEFDVPDLPGGKHTTAHTIRVDASGRVWTSGGLAIQMFDPKTEQFRHFDVPGTYGNEPGQNGDEWFASFRDGGPIVRVSKDGVLTAFQPPTNGKPQRLAIDTDGMVYFSERRGNKIGRLDPASGDFKEYPLPGPEASPYAISIDGEHMVWYSSHEQDTLGRLDPKTGAVTEYPYPHAEISMREMFPDSKGRIWYASSVNNKVGYFFLSNAATQNNTH